MVSGPFQVFVPVSDSSCWCYSSSWSALLCTSSAFFHWELNSIPSGSAGLLIPSIAACPSSAETSWYEAGGRVPGRGRRIALQRSARPNRRRSGSSGVQKLPARRSAISRSSSRRVSGFSPDTAICSAIRRRSRPSFDTGGFALWRFLRDAGAAAFAISLFYRRV